MKNFKQWWFRFVQAFSAAKVLYGVLVAFPAVVATVTAMYAMAENVPRSQLLTMAVVTLAATLLCLNQFRILIGVPVTVKTSKNFAYGLGYVGVGVAYEPSNLDAALQINVVLSNNSRSTLKYRVERMHVVVGTTTLPHKIYANEGGLIPLRMQRVYRDSSFSLAQIQSMIGAGKQSGTVEMEIVYGPVVDDLVRKMRLKLSISVEITSDKATIVDMILLEGDEPCV